MLDQVTALVTENWGTISTVGMAVGGAYALKVKVAIGHVQKAITELEDVRDVTTAAIADNQITADEAERIGKEVSEAIQATHQAVDSVLAVIPAPVRAALPWGKK